MDQKTHRLPRGRLVLRKTAWELMQQYYQE
jgi:hypothetical protein